MSAPRNQFNCLKCPAYCCSYAEIGASDFDIKRLAKHFGLTPEGIRKAALHLMEEVAGVACEAHPGD